MPLAALFLALSASPENAAQAKHLFEKGSNEFAAAHFAAALDDYLQAYALDPFPGFLFNIGQCHRELGHFEQAAEYFRRYLAEKPNAKNADQTRALVAETEAKQAAANGPPPPAAPPTAAPPLVVIQTVPVAPVSNAVPDAALTASPPVAQKSRVAPWVLTGVGGACAVVGAVLGISALSMAGGNKQTADGTETLNSITPRTANTANAFATAALPLLIGGVAIAATGMVWGLTGHSSAQ